MLLKSDNDKPPASKEEAPGPATHPPLEKYDPGKLSHWSITMTLAWIIRRDHDAVRNEWDDYRSGCADWHFEGDPRARVLCERVAIDSFERALDERRTGQGGSDNPDLQKKIQEKLEEFKEGSWHLCLLKCSGWKTLRFAEHLKAILSPQEQAALSLQDAIAELWRAAGEGRIKANAIECKNTKAFDGEPVEIPAHYWPYLKCTDDPSGKPTLSAPDGRVYREVKFPQSDAKGLWPKSPPLSAEPLEPVENPEPDPEKLAPERWLDKVRRAHPQKNERPTAYIRGLHELMGKATDVREVWKYNTFRRRYYEAIKAEQQAAQKKRRSPRTA